MCTLPVQSSPTSRPADAILRTPESNQALQYAITPGVASLLDEVQHATFLYFWREVGASGLAKDRMKAPVASIAAVGFQLTALPIGVERGWITRQEGLDRTLKILHTLVDRDDNKKFGLYYHFLDYDTGGQSKSGFEVLVSTVDSALLFAGAITAAEYFDGEVKTLVDHMLRDANWAPFATGPNGTLSMGWGPDDPERPAGDGKFHHAYWEAAGDEERIIYFLAAGALDPSHAIDPRAYYAPRRTIKSHDDMPPYVVSPLGTLFNYFFSHCWIDYRSLGADDPSRLGVDGPRVDWFENSRRAALTHRRRCVEQASRFKSLSENRWGLSACASRDGYIVPQIRPNETNRDDWHEGTVAPYAAASCIMFTPAESIAAIVEFRNLVDKDGKPVVWRDPKDGGYGFVDSFNLDQNYACDDYVGIDQGPMLLAIENARTGLIWKLFMQSETARRAVDRLKLAN